MVTILLATLNGEDYLKAQLESIAAQTYENWQLVVGDDGSTDGTISLLEEFSKQNPEQVTIIKNDPPQGSATDNFIHLFQILTDRILCFVIRMMCGNQIRFI